MRIARTVRYYLRSSVFLNALDRTAWWNIEGESSVSSAALRSLRWLTWKLVSVFVPSVTSEMIITSASPVGMIVLLARVQQHVLLVIILSCRRAGLWLLMVLAAVLLNYFMMIRKVLFARNAIVAA